MCLHLVVVFMIKWSFYHYIANAGVINNNNGFALTSKIWHYINTVIYKLTLANWSSWRWIQK